MVEITDLQGEKDIPISQLLFDIMNPRLPEIQTSQREAIRAMVLAQGEKVIAMARHIQENGPNPVTPLIVIPSSDEQGKYIVLDGNRRLTAYKILETPTLIDGVLEGKNAQRVRHLAVAFAKKPIAELHCVIFRDRDEADKWIELIHRGENSGAGLVEWDGQVAARYDARKGNKSPALHVLDFVKANAVLTEETQKTIESGKFPITNLERLINTPYVRKKLGIDIENDEVVEVYPSDEVLKGLTKVVEDLASKRVTVSKIKSQEQRIDYVNGLNQTELPQADKVLASPKPLGSSVEGDNGKTGTQPPKSIAGKSLTKRPTLIPKSCKLGVKQQRLQKIYEELKNLDLDVFPNAGAIMLRVFVELSLDYYLEHTSGKTEQDINGMKLASKLFSIANYFEQNKIMTPLQLAPVKTAAGGETILAASVKTLHGYVHNQHFSPVASELKTAWDNLQPFMEKLWSVAK